MFKRILVPVDFSPRNTSAIEAAANLMKAGGERLVLLHVIEPIEHIPADELKSFYSRLEQKALEFMTSMIESLLTSGVQAEQVVLSGPRVHEIVRFAADHDIDLIIMSSHKVNVNEPSKGWGTISYRVAILTPTPVLLVK